MNKSKKTTYKKALVRNTVQEKPQALLINEYEACSSQQEFVKQKSLKEKTPITKTKASLRNENLSLLSAAKFESPELNSALCIARKIQSVESAKSRKVKSVSDLQKKKKLAADEKVTRQVNFPYEQQLYKDLMPLCLKPQSKQIKLTARLPLLQKDVEPCLSDFVAQKTFLDYGFQVPLENKCNNVIEKFDGLGLYRAIQNWNP